MIAGGLAFETEDLARTVLVRIVPRGRYRVAAPNDSRFSAFAPQTVRLAYRQQGAQPSLVLFLNAGQDARAAALAAAQWAAANWRPNAVQKRVRPGVVAVEVGPAARLGAAGPVAGAAVPAAVWTVDSDSGRCTTPGGAPGAPSPGEIKQAAAALARGLHPPALGELDLAERAIMHPRTAGMTPVFTGGLAIILVLFALRFGLSAFGGLYVYGMLLGSGSSHVNPLLALAGVAANLLLLLGIALGLALLLNYRSAAVRVPGFSSSAARARTASWVGYAAVMALLAAATTYALPQAVRAGQNSVVQTQLGSVNATAADDGSEADVAAGGELRVDLSAWPRAEWAGIKFTTSNPSVLTLTGTPSGPLASFRAMTTGAARVDAISADGRYTFQLRVVVVTG